MTRRRRWLLNVALVPIVLISGIGIVALLHLQFGLGLILAAFIVVPTANEVVERWLRKERRDGQHDGEQAAQRPPREWPPSGWIERDVAEWKRLYGIDDA